VLEGGQVKDVELGGTYSTKKRGEKCTYVLQGKPRNKGTTQKIQLFVAGVYEMDFKETSWVEEGVVVGQSCVSPINEASG
jgi:hypothetical protein